MMTAEGRVAAWVPQPRQAAFMARPEYEVLFGGAAGGGKSDALVAEALRQIHIPHYKGLIIRKTFPQLDELIGKSLNLYPQVCPKARYNDSKHVWRFPNGAQIFFKSFPNEQSKINFQGQAYDFVGFDELTHFSQAQYEYLIGRNRPNGPDTRCYMRATANPGGVGHSWVKERFVSSAPPMTTVWSPILVPYPDGRVEKVMQSRIYVPSRVTDNFALMANDPMYIARLASLPEAERKALLEGNWDSYAGQVFSEWSNDPDHYGDRRWTHVVPPFEPPKHWRYYRSMDWGYSKPFSVGWWAVDTDGISYRILEWYGCKRGQADQGVEMTPSAVAEHIVEIEREHPYLKGRRITGVADPAIWQTQTGVRVVEEFERKGVYFERGDNTRLAGWIQLHERLAFSSDGIPRMYIFDTCRAFIRTVPSLVYSETAVEDVDTRQEDHVADEARYFCQLNPVPPRLKQRRENWNPEYDPLSTERRH